METGITRLNGPGMLERCPDFVLIIQALQIFVEALERRDY